MKLFLTKFNLPTHENIYLFRNNSLKSKFILKSDNIKKILNNFNLSFDSIKEQKKNLNYNCLLNFGSWFFRQSFCFTSTGIQSNNTFLYISKSENIFSLISRRLLFFSFVSLLGRGFKISCKLIGVGYRVTSLKNNNIILKLGRSYRVKYQIPSYVSSKVFGKRKSKIRFFSNSLSKLMDFVFLFRALRWPDSYKAKGIKFAKQKLKVKFREKFGSIHYKAKK